MNPTDPVIKQFTGGPADWYLSEPKALLWNAAIDTNFWTKRGGKEAEYRVYALEGDGDMSKFVLKPHQGMMARPEFARQ
jgi:hypothetical protein